MNDPHKFSKEFGSDHALEQRTAIVSHHDTIKWFEAIPAELKPGQRTGKFRLGNDQLLVDAKRPEQVFRSGLRRRDD
jgi:putative NADH-flavin reductase